MKIFNAQGRELFPRVFPARPSDNATPSSYLSPHVGIFANAPGLQWEFAEICENMQKRFVQNDGTQRLVWICQENCEGRRWSKPELSLMPR